MMRFMHPSRFAAAAICASVSLLSYLPASHAADRKNPAAAASASAAARLAALADSYYEASARLDPLGATFTGDNRFDDRLTMTIAPAKRAKLYALNRDVERKLGAIDRSVLSEADATTYDSLQYAVRAVLAFERFKDELLPINHMDSVPVVLANFASGQGAQPIATVAQYDAYLRRIAAMPAWIEQALANMRVGMRRGIVQPRALIESALPPIRALSTGTPEENVFYTPIRNLPAAFSAKDKTRLTAAYRQVVARQLQPSLRKLTAFLETEYLPASRKTSGWGALPDGDAWYKTWVHAQTTTDLTPEEIHQLGLREVARIHAEMAKVGPRLGYAGPPAGLGAWMDAQPRFKPFRSDGEILAAYRTLNDRIRLRLPGLFGRSPKAGLDIRPEPELTRATASDHYDAPAADGSRPGIFWTVIHAPAQYEMPGMTSLFLHEGQPGHHFQLALQQELALPKFRKYGGNNAYVEGWALYAETLGRELGLYADPAAYAGHLRAELHRAVRLVVDTGLHAKGWTREATMQYMREVQGISDTAAKQSTERYMAFPGQALSYKIGALKIMELRQRASIALGEKFRLSEFHDMVLGDAALPLSLLEAKIARWIKQQGGDKS
jgi:uncharacterized protein (DUF885 family)